MSDEPKKRSRAWIGWTLIALFVVYPLSMGPVGWISNRNQSWRIFNAAYAPLILALRIIRTDLARNQLVP